MSKTFETRAQVLKVDDSLGLVFGWGLITSEGDQPYFDTQGDHITDEAMLEAVTDFMLKSRIAADMHPEREEDGSVRRDGDVVFAFPLTADVAKAFGIETDRTGLLVAVKPSPEVLGKFRDGTYTGFSIGGRRIAEEVVEP